MRINLIAYIKSIKKIANSLLLIIALCVVNCVNGVKVSRPLSPGQQVGLVPVSPATPQPAPAAQQPTTVQPSAPLLTQSQQASAQDLTLWTLQQSVPWTQSVRDAVNNFWASLTDVQRRMIDDHYRQQVEIQRLQAQSMAGQPAAISPFARQAAPVQTSPFAAGKKVKKIEEPGRFGSLFDYESYLNKFVPEGGVSGGMGALMGAVGAVTALNFGPAILGYLGYMGALKLAGTAWGLDRIAAGIRMGHWSRADAVDMVKNIFEQIINDGGAYPTYKVQIEGLKNDNEFSAVTKLDKSIIDDARAKLIAEIKERQKNLDNPENANDKARQDAINAAIANIQSTTFKQGDSVEQYANKLADQGNAVQCQAFVSEFVRARIHAAVEKTNKQFKALAKIAKQKAEEEAAKAPTTTAPQKSWWRDYLGRGVH